MTADRFSKPPQITLHVSEQHNNTDTVISSLHNTTNHHHHQPTAGWPLTAGHRPLLCYLRRKSHSSAIHVHPAISVCRYTRPRPKADRSNKFNALLVQPQLRGGKFEIPRIIFKIVEKLCYDFEVLRYLRQYNTVPAIFLNKPAHKRCSLRFF